MEIQKRPTSLILSKQCALQVDMQLDELTRAYTLMKCIPLLPPVPPKKNKKTYALDHDLIPERKTKTREDGMANGNQGMQV